VVLLIKTVEDIVKTETRIKKIIPKEILKHGRVTCMRKNPGILKQDKLGFCELHWLL
jgi:hypothetical protein